jgi:hypothetical protein
VRAGHHGRSHRFNVDGIVPKSHLLHTLIAGLQRGLGLQEEPGPVSDGPGSSFLPRTPTSTPPPKTTSGVRLTAVPLARPPWGLPDSECPHGGRVALHPEPNSEKDCGLVSQMPRIRRASLLHSQSGSVPAIGPETTFAAARTAPECT